MQQITDIFFLSLTITKQDSVMQPINLPVESNLKKSNYNIASDGVLEYSTRVLLEYHFWGTRTRHP